MQNSPLPPPIPDQVVTMHIVDQMVPVIALIAVVVGVIITYAIWSRNRRLSRTPAMPALGPIDDRLARLEQSVEAIGLEVERIAEGQRFVTKMLADAPRSAAQLPSGR